MKGGNSVLYNILMPWRLTHLFYEAPGYIFVMILHLRSIGKEHKSVVHYQEGSLRIKDIANNCCIKINIGSITFFKKCTEEY